MSHDYASVFRAPDDDTAWQAYPFDPTTADRAAVNAERAREQSIREDQRDRIITELKRYDELWPIELARSVSVEPGW